VDNLVLIRVTAALDRRLRQAALREVRSESKHRYRLIFESTDGVASLIISLKPEAPWIGRPAGRWEGPKVSSSFGGTFSRALKGGLVAAVEKASADRLVTIRFVDGQALVAELATHGANLVLLDAGGKVVASARRPPSAQERLTPGEPYRPPELPGALLNPFEASAEEIDRFLESFVEGGESPFDAIKRRLFGIGSQAAALLLEEAAESGRSAGTILRERLDSLQRGDLDPVIREGESAVLFPWPPADDGELISKPDAAATAGLYYEGVEARALAAGRKRALKTILEREARRLFRAENSARRDLALFKDPERYKLWGEALLAGLGQAKRAGDVVMVPDPYGGEAGDLAVPAKPGLSLQKVADDHFKRYRRAERGLRRARERVDSVVARRERLEALQVIDAVDELQQAMRGAGLPVGLEPATRAGRAAAMQQKPRLEGVRLYTSSDGVRIMAGRSGQENHRLTFKLATPEDFWFHALGRPGAHVVARNEDRAASPPKATLEEAAAVAAWFSDAGRDEYVEVQWTRRKYVRKPRGAKPGTVILKKFATIRVRPRLPKT
jgi:predicted ribosome quality control (RQC) complex YloA/Tae2 family protein